MGCIAAGGESVNVGRMAGIGEGTGPLSVEIPVERVRQYVYQVHSDEGPGLTLVSLLSDKVTLVTTWSGYCPDLVKRCQAASGVTQTQPTGRRLFCPSFSLGSRGSNIPP